MENNGLAVFKMNFDCGRQGSLTGIFVEQKSHIKWLIDSKKEVYFGEALGKHSDVCGPIEETDIKMVTDDQDVVRLFAEHGLESGFNPMEYTFDYTEVDDEEGTVREFIEKKIKESAQ